MARGSQTLNLSPEFPSYEGLGADLHHHETTLWWEAPASHCCAADSHGGKDLESPGHKGTGFSQAGPAKRESGT